MPLIDLAIFKFSFSANEVTLISASGKPNWRSSYSQLGFVSMLLGLFMLILADQIPGIVRSVWLDFGAAFFIVGALTWQLLKKKTS